MRTRWINNANVIWRCCSVDEVTVNYTAHVDKINRDVIFVLCLEYAQTIIRHDVSESRDRNQKPKSEREDEKRFCGARCFGRRILARC
jgi:hypothetical protein